MVSILLFFKKVFLYAMKKYDLFSDTGGKLIVVFHNEGFQFFNILTSSMVHHHKMLGVILGVSANTIEIRTHTINKITVCSCPQMEYPINSVS